MPSFPTQKVSIRRPSRTVLGNDLDVQYHIIERNVRCELHPLKTQAIPGLPGTRCTTVAEGILNPKVDLRYGDHLIEPSGRLWFVEGIVRTDLVCHCALREIESA